MRIKEFRLAELRYDKNISQRVIAEYLNTSANTYSKWECGTNDIPLVTINKIANYFQVNLDYLLGLSNKNIDTEYKEINFELLHKRLLELRKEFQLSQKKLSDALGFPQTTYSNYENGTSIPTMHKLRYIALFYSISFDFLVGRTNQKEIK